MNRILEAKAICDDFCARQEEQWYRRDEFIESTVKELEELMPLDDDGSSTYIEVMATYEALKDEMKGVCYAYLW